MARVVHQHIPRFKEIMPRQNDVGEDIGIVGNDVDGHHEAHGAQQTEPGLAVTRYAPDGIGVAQKHGVRPVGKIELFGIAEHLVIEMAGDPAEGEIPFEMGFVGRIGKVRRRTKRMSDHVDQPVGARGDMGIVDHLVVHRDPHMAAGRVDIADQHIDHLEGVVRDGRVFMGAGAAVIDIRRGPQRQGAPFDLDG